MKKLVLIIIACGIVVGCGNPEKTDSGEVKSDSEVEAVNTETVDNTGDETDKTDSAQSAEQKPQMEGKIVAHVNGVPVYESEVRHIRPFEAVTDEILYQYGLNNGIDQKYAEKLYNYKKQLIVADVKKDISENLPPAKEISDEDIQSYYDANKPKYMFIRLNEITFTNKDLSDDILTRAKDGEDLKAIESSYADTDNVVTVNELGFNREFVLRYKIEELGQVTEVIEKPNGEFSIIKAVETKDIPMAQTKSSIKSILESKRDNSEIHKKARSIAEENNYSIEFTN